MAVKADTHVLLWVSWNRVEVVSRDTTGVMGQAWGRQGRNLAVSTASQTATACV